MELLVALPSTSIKVKTRPHCLYMQLNTNQDVDFWHITHSSITAGYIYITIFISIMIQSISERYSRYISLGRAAHSVIASSDGFLEHLYAFLRNVLSVVYYSVFCSSASVTTCLDKNYWFDYTLLHWLFCQFIWFKSLMRLWKVHHFLSWLFILIITYFYHTQNSKRHLNSWKLPAIWEKVLSLLFRYTENAFQSWLLFL